MRWRLYIIASVLVCGLAYVSLQPSTVDAASGDLDTSFGSGGKVFLTYGLASDNNTGASGVALQQDGKLVISGSFSSSSGSGSALARLNPDGSLDASFGTGGVVRPAPNSGFVVLLADGKIIVMSSSSVVRYGANGSVDVSFGSGGVTGFINYNLVIQFDQKVIVVGASLQGNGFLVARYNSDGNPDQTFGTGGQVITTFTDATGFFQADQAKAVAVQPDGKIVVAGNTGFSQTPGSFNFSFAVARYNPDGSLDSAFGNGGKIITQVTTDRCSSVAVQPDGKIIVGGWSNTGGGGSDAVMLRSNANGTLDNSFGTAGQVRTNYGQSRHSTLRRVLLQPDGKIVTVGAADRIPDTIAGPSAWVVMRYNSDGTPDQTFGVNGKVETTMTGVFYHAAFDGAMQPDGKIIAVGSFQDQVGNFRATVATPTPTPLPVPHLLTEESSEKAIALDSVTLLAEPFSVFSDHNLISDRQTRIVLFAINADLQAKENPSVVTAQAEDL
jgi:uncharacterized delta-60 repeat protein